ncbi:nuclear transport factor 2 family protein [Thalassobacillus hwangdonensis]|uniref:Nuclear transport factor 2 family protein n=1 Tax=Thalassobacillus hwangdonensis TaxID=546108 RepID=A0ABW3L5M1_9BACI
MATEKGKVLQQMNEAFVHGDFDNVLEHVTDDIQWTQVGGPFVKGKEAFREACREMGWHGPDTTLTIHSIITHGLTAALEGVVEMIDKNGGKKTYAFCDTYRFNTFKNGKIKEIRSYVIRIKK